MKKFTVPCNFGSVKAPVNFYVGEASKKRNPLYYQSLWLKTERDGVLPAEVLEAFQKLSDIAIENNVSFEELCVYALGTASSEDSKDSH